MKIKRWLTISYIIVILSPVISGLILFNWINQYNKEIELKEYLYNMDKFEEYEDILMNSELYTNYNQKYELVKEDDQDYIKIKLYDRHGYNLYSSVANDFLFTMDRENLFKGLYEIEGGYNRVSMKKPVYQDNQIVGIYEMSIARTELIEGVNVRSLIALGLFVLNFVIVLTVINRLINRKINRPLNLLISSMEGFGSGKNININYKSNDEIGELIKYFDRMKDKIEEKNIEIQNQQKSKEYMIAAISHDLKSPLTSIRAYTELIDPENNLGDKNKKYKDIVLSKSDYMANMLDDLFAYTLLTSDYKMGFVTTEGQEFFEMLTSGYEEVCEMEGLEYKSFIRVNGIYKVDVKQMIRVLDNLISNAIKYSSRGGKVYVGAFSDDVYLPSWLDKTYQNELDEFRKGGVLLVVKNNGKEISKKDIQNILNPFYKIDNSRKNIKESGTGLGLSIVNLIIGKHLGKVKVLSDKNKGTVVACFIKKLEE